MCKGIRISAALLLLGLAPSVVRAEEAGERTFVPPTTLPFPTAFWLATQALPSPLLVADDDQVRFGLRWQVTPLLYSWAANRKVFGWRLLVVEPNLRHGGSLELFTAPEVLFLERTTVLLRPGLRSYVPLLERGEMLSASVGVSFQDVQGTQSVAFEAGVYLLFGILGVQLSHAPAPGAAAHTIATLSLRYF